MKTTSRFLALFFALTTGIPVSASEPSEDALLEAARVSREAPSVPGAQSDLERKAINAAGGAARRAGDRLILSLRDGSDLSRTDDNDTFIDVPHCRNIEIEREGLNLAGDNSKSSIDNLLRYKNLRTGWY